MKKILIIFFIVFSQFCEAQNIKPFPGALGGGALSFNPEITYTLREVTNMDDSGTGSLYSAIQDNSIVVFRVSGIMDWNQGFHDDARTKNNCIILGQTAPQGGVTIVNNGARFENSTNLVFRYISFRLWRGRTLLYDPSSSDILEFLSCNNVILDHVSGAFGGDESISTRGAAYNYTMQNSIVSFGHAGSLMGDSNDYTLYGDHSSLGNFWHTIGKRMPNPNGNGRFDNIGNAAYNLLNLGMRTGGDLLMNDIGNYLRNVPNHHLNLDYTPLVYTANNRKPEVLTANGQDNSVIYQGRAGQRDPIASDFTNTMHALINFDIPLPDGDDTFLRVQNREMGNNKYLDNSGNPVFQLDDLDIEAYDQWDNDERFDWTDPSGLVTSDPTNRTQTNHRVIPQRQWLPDNEPNFGVVVNTHSQTTHTGVVPNSWITAQGLTPATFDPLGNDLDPNYPNIMVYSFNVDGAVTTTYPPTGITIANETQTSFTVSWNANTEANGYTVDIDGVEVSVLTGTTYNASGLTAGSTYSVKITSQDNNIDIGNATVQAATLPNIPPPATLNGGNGRMLFNNLGF